MTKVMQKLQAMIDQARLFDSRYIEPSANVSHAYESWEVMENNKPLESTCDSCMVCMFMYFHVAFCFSNRAFCRLSIGWMDGGQKVSRGSTVTKRSISDSFSLLLLLFRSWLMMDQTQEIIA